MKTLNELYAEAHLIVSATLFGWKIHSVNAQALIDSHSPGKVYFSVGCFIEIQKNQFHWSVNGYSYMEVIEKLKNKLEFELLNYELKMLNQDKDIGI